MTRLIFILLVLFFTGNQSHAQSMERPSAYQQLKGNFGSDELSPQQLNAFDQRAAQKVKDFFSLLEICYRQADTSLNDLFVKSANSYFVSEASLFLGQFSNNDSFNIPNLFKDIASKNIQISSFEIDLTLNKKLTKIDENYFAGNFKLHLNTKLLPDQNSKLLVDYYLLKEEKEFGKEIRKIWEVKLGDIKTN